MRSTALLVMDVQRGIVERFAPGSERLIGNLDRAIHAARSTGLPVIYVRIAFRSGAPEISRRNKGFAARATSWRSGGEDEEATWVHSAIEPQPGDVVILKKRVSAFTGSDLDVVLRSLEVDALVLTGIATSGVVLSTFHQAADLDFGLTVLRDGCLDADEEIHHLLMEKVFPRNAEVIDTDDWVGLLGADRDRDGGR